GRAVSLRLIQSRRRARTRSLRGLLAQDAQRKAALLQSEHRYLHPPGDAQARGSRHRVRDHRSARRGGAALAGAYLAADSVREHTLAPLRRPMESKLSLA